MVKTLKRTKEHKCVFVSNENETWKSIVIYCFKAKFLNIISPLECGTYTFEQGMSRCTQTILSTPPSEWKILAEINPKNDKWLLD